jgi:hypothetical protein
MRFTHFSLFPDFVQTYLSLSNILLCPFTLQAPLGLVAPYAGNMDELIQSIRTKDKTLRIKVL